MEQSEEVRAYLRAKYKREREAPGAAEAFAVFDPWIHPDDAYIPYCASCLKDFEDYKMKCADTCEMDHTPACLWYDYFTGRIKKLNQAVVFVLKKDIT